MKKYSEARHRKWEARGVGAGAGGCAHVLTCWRASRRAYQVECAGGDELVADFVLSGTRCVTPGLKRGHRGWGEVEVGIGCVCARVYACVRGKGEKGGREGGWSGVRGKVTSPSGVRPKLSTTESFAPDFRSMSMIASFPVATACQRWGSSPRQRYADANWAVQAGMGSMACGWI